MTLTFTIIGVDQVTTDPTIRFRCSTNDGESIFIGSDSINSVGHVWQYKNGTLAKITDNLESEQLLSINSIVTNNNTLYVGTGGKYLDYGKGQVWGTYGDDWQNTGLQFPSNANILIRKLLSVGNDVFAAGTAAYIYKLSSGVWSQVYPGSLNVFNYTDLETDGQNVYAAANSFDAQLVSGILKFDGNSWSAISQPGFGVSSNLLVTKLEYFNNKLYAGTFNEISGCEVWEYNNVSWSRIASGGLGDTNNIKVFDIKSNQTDLIVSMENPTGGKISIYNNVSGWRDVPINSNVKYDSYLIECFSSNNYLIGTQTMRILPDTSTTIKYTAQQRIASGANFWPDGSFAPVPIGGGQYRFIGSNAYRPMVTQGTLEDPMQTVLSPTGIDQIYAGLGVTSTRFQQFLELKPDTVSGQLGEVFDITNTSGISYFGAGVNYVEQTSGVVLHFYHTEEGYWTLPVFTGTTIRPPGGWDSDIRQAVSFDDGLTYYDCGSVIKSNYPASPSGPLLQGLGETFAGVRKVGNYLYGYYWSDISGSNGQTDGQALSIARAPYSGVISYALNKQVYPNWEKYYNGSFSQPGQKGIASDLFNNPYLVPVRKHMGTFYSSSLGKIVNFVTNPLTVLDSNLYVFKFGSYANTHVMLSDDGFNFGYPQRLDVKEGGNNYISVIGSSVHEGMLDSKAYIYGTYSSGLPNWDTIALSKLDVSTLPIANINRSYLTTPYSPADLSFTIIGIDEITTSPTERFRCSTNDGNSIYVGSDSTSGQGRVWRYEPEAGWSDISDNINPAIKSICSIKYNDTKLYVGTQSSFATPYAGQILVNGGKGDQWENVGQLAGTVGSNAALRSILFKDGDLYTAGSYYFIWKYSNNTWSEPVNFTNAGLSSQFICDLETDGTNIYAGISNNLGSGITAEVYRFNNVSWSKISNTAFNDINNLSVTKLCWYNDKLYAATYNDQTGAEIWEYDGASWSQINSDGFGFNGNYHVVDMKIVLGKLVVSLETISGGRIWSYTEIQGWKEETINPDVIYKNYLIESVDGINYLIGTSRKNFITSYAPSAWLTTPQRKAVSAHYFPDGFVGCVPIENNKYRFIGPNSLWTFVTEGTLLNPFENIISQPRYSEYLKIVDPLGSSGVTRGTDVLDKKSDFSGSFNTTSQFDPIYFPNSRYMSGGVVYKVPSTSTLIVWCHGEEGYWDSTSVSAEFVGPLWNGMIRQIVSFDNGNTFYDCGRLIECRFSARPNTSVSATVAINTGGYIIKDGYFYLYYGSDVNEDLEGFDGQTQLSVARANYNEVIQAANNKQVASWYKYYNGQFSEPSINGNTTDLITDWNWTDGWCYGVSSAQLNNHVFFNSTIRNVIDFNLFFETTTQQSPTYVFKNEFYSVFSKDGFTWSFPEKISSFAASCLYTTPLNTESYRGLLSDTFLALGQISTFWSELTTSTLYQPVTVQAVDEEVERIYSVGQYTTNNNFTIFVKNGNDWIESIPYTKLGNAWKLSLPYVKDYDYWYESSPIKQGKEEVDVYFYIGDSIAEDAAGYASGLLQSNEYSGLYSSVPGCYTLRTVESPQTTGEFGPFTGYRFEEVRTGINTNPVKQNVSGTAGADIVLFHKLRQSSNNDIYIIKYGLGGSRFVKEASFFDWSPRSSAEDFGDLFFNYINALVIPALSLLKQNNKNPIFKGGFITLGTNIPTYISKQEFTKEQINLDSSGLVSGLISSFRNAGINTDIAKIVWILPDRIRLFSQPGLDVDPYGSDYREYFNAVVSSVNNLSSIFNFASGYDPSAWASLSNTGDYGHPSTSGHIKIAESVFNNFFYTGP